MTKEDAIKLLRQIYPNGGHCWLDSQRIEALDMAIEALSQPSLPSNLDEAAESIIRGICPISINGEYYFIRKQLFDVFIAGAEWMASQYKTLGETEIYLEED